MAKLKYRVMICKECEIDFITRNGNYCSKCGDNLYVEKERTIWLEKPVVYKRPWTEEDDEILIESVRRGIKNQDIADDLGRTKDAVAERLRRIRKTKKVVRGVRDEKRSLPLEKKKRNITR